MHFSLLLLAPALLFGGAAESKKPTPYKYTYQVEDTQNYKSPFLLFDTTVGTGFSYSRPFQLKPTKADGVYIPVIDASSPVLQLQLDHRALETVDYTGDKKNATGVFAGLQKAGRDPKSNTKYYEIIFSKKMSPSEVGFREFSLFGPSDDGRYDFAAGAPAKGGVFFFAFALCKKANGSYYQLEFVETVKGELGMPKGCLRTFPFVSQPSLRATISL